jgi:flagellar secretion chaperone FliS
MNATAALRQYRGVGTQGGVIDSNPHQLILMLIDGAIEKTATARGNMLRGETVEKGRGISGAIAIVDTLRANLDHKAGGEIADNLASLYDYMSRRLVESNATNQPKLLQEVISLLKEVKEAWVAIPQEYRAANRRSGSCGMMSVSPQ